MPHTFVLTMLNLGYPGYRIIVTIDILNSKLVMNLLIVERPVFVMVQFSL